MSSENENAVNPDPVNNENETSLTTTTTPRPPTEDDRRNSAFLAAACSESHIQSQIFPATGFDVETYLVNLKRAFAEEALKRTKGSIGHAAALLRLEYMSFYKYVKTHGIEVNRKI